MTVNYTDTAQGRIRSFLWNELTTNKILNENDYIADGFDIPLIPIIPVQQIPEFNNLIGDKPYLVYTFDNVNYSDTMWWVCHERLAFSIISADYNKIIQISNFMVDLFRRMDESATDINNFQNDSKFKFFMFAVTSITSPEPFEQEGGRQMASLELDFKYSRELDSNGRYL